MSAFSRVIRMATISVMFAVLASSSLLGQVAASPNLGGHVAGLASQPGTITVNSYWTNGTQIQGMYIELMVNGTDVQTGYTPITFNTTADLSYQILANNWTQEYFATWSIPQAYENPINIGVASSVNFTLTAVYLATNSTT
jgi:hypothetical protein